MKRTFIMRIASSWWLTVLFCFLLIATYLAAAFGEQPFDHWIAFLLHSWTGLALYCGLALNIVFAGIRIVMRGLRTPIPSREKIQHMDTYFTLSASETDGLDPASAWMASQGYPATRHTTGLSSVKGKYSFLPGTIMRAGIALLLAALLVSAHTRKSGELVLHEAEQGNILGEKIILRSISATLPADYLQVGDESSFKLDDVRASLETSGASRIVATQWPVRINDRYCRIVHLGYAQQLTVTTPAGSFSKPLDLDILPPGKSQIITPGADDLLLTVSLHPERTISKGLLTGKQYNLDEPWYRIIIQNTGSRSRPIEVLLRAKEKASVNGATLSLGTSSRFITLAYVRDPSLRFIYAGIALFLGGCMLMLSRFFWYRKEMAAVLDGDDLLIGFQEEFYRKWGILKFHIARNGLRQKKRD